MKVVKSSSCDRKYPFLVFPLFTVLSIALGLVSFVAHQKLTVLEARITELHTDQEIPEHRLKRHINEYFDTESINSKWRQDITSQVELLIRDLVAAAVTNLEKICGKSKVYQPGKVGGKPPLGLADLPTACCERLAAPIFDGPNPDKVLATAGKGILLPCLPSIGYPTPVITWDVNPNDTSFVYDTNGLSIPSVEGRHEGSYMCTASNIFGTANKTVELEIKASVNTTVNLTVPTGTFFDGQSTTANLVCEFTGVPTPIITWRHIGLDGTNETITRNIQTDIDRSTLTFTKLKFLDSGVYECIATNRYQTVKSVGVLNVEAPPVVLTKRSTKTVLVGSDVILDCIVISNPIAIVTWTLPVVSGHKPFNVFDNGDGSVTIRDAVQINEGDYTCVATNSHGSKNSTTTVDVIEPITVKISSPRHPLSDSVQFVAMDCRATGDPKPSITWNKLGTVLDTLNTSSRYIFLENGDFIISSVNPDTYLQDSGVYTCTATNAHYKNTAYAIVYFDHGAITCKDTFDGWNNTIGVSHGANCSPGCLKEGRVFGSNPYISYGPVCQSAIHSGVIAPDIGGLVYWYTGSVSHGILSMGTTKHGVHSYTFSTSGKVPYIVTRSTGLYPLASTSQPSTESPIIGK